MKKGLRLSTTYNDSDGRFKEVVKTLKPCPFCGTTKNLDIVVIDGSQTYLAVECAKCDFELPAEFDFFKDNVREIVSKWNNRPKEK